MKIGGIPERINTIDGMIDYYDFVIANSSKFKDSTELEKRCFELGSELDYEDWRKIRCKRFYQIMQTVSKRSEYCIFLIFFLEKYLGINEHEKFFKEN